MQMGVWTEDDDCRRRAVGGGRIDDIREDGAEEGVNAG